MIAATAKVFRNLLFLKGTHILCDTDGLRKRSHQIEQTGIQRSLDPSISVGWNPFHDSGSAKLSAHLRRYSLIMLICFPVLAPSQPSLKLYGVSLENYPEVRLYFDIFDDLGYDRDASSRNLSIKENGVTVRPNDVYCSSSYNELCMSLSFCFDRHLRGGDGFLDTAKQGAQMFIDRMDGGCDEASIVDGNASEANVYMTNDKGLLQYSLNYVKPDTASALWDRVLASLKDVAENCTQAGRAVLIFTDGFDEGSTRSVQDVIDVALRWKIHLVLIPCGDRRNDPVFQQMKNETNATIIQSIDSKSIRSFWQSFTLVPVCRFNPCQISFVSTLPCANGSTRTIELMVDSLDDLEGTDTKVILYTAPLDSANVLQLKVNEVVGDRSDFIDVPLSLYNPPNIALSPSTITLRFDTACAHFTELITHGSLLDGDSVRWERLADGLRIHLLSTKIISSTGTFAKLRFFQKQSTKEDECPLTLEGWTLKPECKIQRLISGRITMIGNPLSVKRVAEKHFSLSQNYPNPFSESTTILLPLLLGEGWGEVVTFKCYDLFGREVLDLSEEARSNSSVKIRASQLPGAGIYFYRLTSNGISQTKIMVVR